MYGRMFDGLGGCLAVVFVLAAVGIAAIAAFAWWVLQNTSISWGGA